MRLDMLDTPGGGAPIGAEEQDCEEVYGYENATRLYKWYVSAVYAIGDVDDVSCRLAYASSGNAFQSNPTRQRVYIGDNECQYIHKKGTFYINSI